MAAPLTLFAEQALLLDGWQRNVRLEIGSDGRFTAVAKDADPQGAERLGGPVLPGLTNLHSHAFQRAMAGLTERTSQGGEDNFWSWREVMYRFLAKLEPDDVEAIATWLYIELLRSGYTGVVEFHYLHHAPDGRPYADRAELSWRILRAAAKAGISVTLLPVLYAHSGFSGAPPTPGQRRFVHGLSEYARLVEELAAALPAWPQAGLGIAPHSLRAVTPEELKEAVALAARLGDATPIHIHVAEQQAEVSACVRALGTTPVQWLLENLAIDERFCCIHATHLDQKECADLARSGAVVGLCPTTEANLGDGIFSGAQYLESGGRFGIGSDSNVSVDPFEELRLLEYSQRLSLRRRNVFCREAGQSVAGALFGAALRGGSQAAGQTAFGIAKGARADLIVLDAEDASLAGRSGDALLDAAVFGPSRGLVRDVLCAGRFVVRDRMHPAHESALAAYRATLRRLL